MEFREDPETLEIFRTAGCAVHGERVRFEPGFCRATIQATAPRVFTQHARKPAALGRDRRRTPPCFCPSFGPAFVHDMEGGRRYASMADFENFTRLHHLLPAVHHSGGVVCEPVDLPVPERHLHMARAHLTLNDKPFMGAVTARERAEDTVEMVKLVFGADFVDRNCCLYSVVNTNAPLVLDATMLWALKVYARANQAVVVSPFVLGGAMSPVSVAGTLAQILAEVLAGLCSDPAASARRPVRLRHLLLADLAAVRCTHLRHARGHAVPDVRPGLGRAPRRTVPFGGRVDRGQGARRPGRL